MSERENAVAIFFILLVFLIIVVVIDMKISSNFCTHVAIWTIVYIIFLAFVYTCIIFYVYGYYESEEYIGNKYPYTAQLEGKPDNYKRVREEFH